MTHHEADHGPETPSPAQIAAAITLLADERTRVIESARRRLLGWGEHAAASLRDASEADDARLRMRARALLRTLEVRACLRRFASLKLGASGKNNAASLLQGAVLSSQMVRTFVPTAEDVAGRLRGESAALRKACRGRSLPTCARLLAERLHGGLGLQGADAASADLDHVSIDRVLERRTGVPVTLSLLYLLVARWAGLSAAGVAMPDHFLVRLHGPRPVLVDPYHGGRTVTKIDCARYLRAGGHGRIRDHLRDLADREVLICYLRSLQRAANLPALPDTKRTLGDALALLETN